MEKGLKSGIKENFYITYRKDLIILDCKSADCHQQRLERQLIKKPSGFIAFGAGSGLIYPAPGTWGSLFALFLAFLIVKLGANAISLFVLTVILFLVGTVASHYTAKALKQEDPPSIVIDEIVALLFILVFIPFSWGYWLIAFLLFRFFDIVKPIPVRTIDQTIKGGLGVMLDDLVAAF